MNLNAYAAKMKMEIFEDLQQGRPPRTGSFNETTLAEAKRKGAPRVGTTTFAPTSIILEYIYPDPASSATILAVTLEAPERIVFLPVPGWVIENIWQGDIDGSYHFESDALRLVAEFNQELDPGANLKWFEPRQAKRRE